MNNDNHTATSIEETNYTDFTALLKEMNHCPGGKKTINDFELYFEESHALSSRDDKDIAEYVDYFLQKDHIKHMQSDVKNAIKDKWMNILKVFNENHKYLGYDIIIFRKRLEPEEPELFISK